MWCQDQHHATFQASRPIGSQNIRFSHKESSDAADQSAPAVVQSTLF
jgi:hypothetical protein